MRRWWSTSTWGDHELTANRPGNVSYIVLRLADDSFVHVSFHDHGDDEVNPIASTAGSTSRQPAWSALTSQPSSRDALRRRWRVATGG